MGDSYFPRFYQAQERPAGHDHRCSSEEIDKTEGTETDVRGSRGGGGNGREDGTQVREGRKATDSDRQVPTLWRTHPDAFGPVWEEEEILEYSPTMEAKTLFEYLCRTYEGSFQEVQRGGKGAIRGIVTLIVLGRKGLHGVPFRRPHWHFPIH